MSDFTKIGKYNQHSVMEELRIIAYHKWIDAGRPEGKDVEFWCDAEREMFGATCEEMSKAYDEMLDKFAKE